MPRGIAGSGTTTRARRTTRATTSTRARSPSSSTAQQIIWQGACLDGQHLFQLTKSGMVWQLYELNFTGANTASRRMVTTQAMFIEAFAAIGSQYALLMGMVPSSRLAYRSVRASAANAIPGAIAAQPAIAAAKPSASATRRVRRRV